MSGNSSSYVILIDGDSFFWSCELIFRPDLIGKPGIILSNNDGCAVSRNRLAKKLGIAMGDPYFKIRNLCEENGVVAFSSNFELYLDISRRFKQILKEEVGGIEDYSVDESFANWNIKMNLRKFAKHLRFRLLREVGIPTTVSISPTKVLAKVGSRIGKNDPKMEGVMVFESHKEADNYLKEIPADKLWGIGSGRYLQLRCLGIHSAHDLKYYENTKLLRKNLTKVVVQIRDELRGIECFPVSEIPEKKKEIMSTRTFFRSVYTKFELARALSDHISDASAELRLQGSVAKEVTIYLSSNRHRDGIEQYSFKKSIRIGSATDNTFRLIELALGMLELGFKNGIEYKRSGIKLSQLEDNYEYTLSLFEPIQSEKISRLITTMDSINSRFGKRKVHSLSCSTDNLTWRMNRSNLSPAYTTNFNELPICG